MTSQKFKIFKHHNNIKWSTKYTSTFHDNTCTFWLKTVTVRCNITCPTYPDKFIHETMLLRRLCDFRLQLSHCLHEYPYIYLLSFSLVSICYISAALMLKLRASLRLRMLSQSSPTPASPAPHSCRSCCRFLFSVCEWVVEVSTCRIRVDAWSENAAREKVGGGSL